jgi:hypothetical protein
MSGLSPKLPLTHDHEDGFYTLNKTHPELVKQNLKMVLLTNPGERMWDVDFGVGLPGFLFEPNIESTWGTIDARLHNQVAIYLPYLELEDVSFLKSEDGHFLTIRIRYRIKPLELFDELEVSSALPN